MPLSRHILSFFFILPAAYYILFKLQSRYHFSLRIQSWTSPPIVLYYVLNVPFPESPTHCCSHSRTTCWHTILLGWLIISVFPNSFSYSCHFPKCPILNKRVHGHPIQSHFMSLVSNTVAHTSSKNVEWNGYKVNESISLKFLSNLKMLWFKA